MLNKFGRGLFASMSRVSHKQSLVLGAQYRNFASQVGHQTLEKDYYSILQVPSHATNDEIKEAYRRLAKKYHPDVRSQQNAEAAERQEYDPDVEKFRDVVEAYQILSVKESRATFDLSRRKNPHLYQAPEDIQGDMAQHRNQRVSPRSKPARGSYAEQRLAHLQQERKKYNVNDLGYYNGGVPRPNRGSLRGDAMMPPGFFHSP
jgi:curved DNA-binding protein CbpA